MVGDRSAHGTGACPSEPTNTGDTPRQGRGTAPLARLHGRASEEAAAVPRPLISVAHKGSGRAGLGPPHNLLRGCHRVTSKAPLPGRVTALWVPAGWAGSPAQHRPERTSILGLQDSMAPSPAMPMRLLPTTGPAWSRGHGEEGAMAGVQGLRLCSADAPGAGSDAEGSQLLCQPESMGLYNKQSIDRSLRCRQSPAASGFLGAASPPFPRCWEQPPSPR